MKSSTLISYLRETDIPARTYFQNRATAKQRIRDELSDNREFIFEYMKNSQAGLNVSPVNCVTLDLGPDVTECVHLIRLKPNEENVLIVDYDAIHLTYSLTTHFLFADYPMKDKLDAIVFTWYYYWFMHRDKDVGDMTHNVCFQLEEMIKTVMTKEYTLYKDYKTAEAIAALRARLASERLVNMASTSVPSKGVNLRRL